MMSDRHTQRSLRIGRSLISLCGGALALNLLLVLGLLVLIAWQGLGIFWQGDLILLTLRDGTRVLGEIRQEEEVPAELAEDPSDPGLRLKIEVGNRDFFGYSFRWIDAREVVSEERPDDVLVAERDGRGRFYGRFAEIRRGDEVLAAGPEATWNLFRELAPGLEEVRQERGRLLEGPIQRLTDDLLDLRRQQRGIELRQLEPEEERTALAEVQAEIDRKNRENEEFTGRLADLQRQLDAETLVLEEVNGQRREMPLGGLLWAEAPNRMGFLDKVGFYFVRFWELLTEYPRESNTAGGIYPAIFGTVLMVFLMTIFVVPLGVLAAIYLREYARQGPLVRMVRIAVNNLAGTPSIVFGAFGLGFFVYLVGGTIDDLFYPEYGNTPKFGQGGILWASLTLALLTVPVVIVATEEGLAAVPRSLRQGSLALGATKWETIRRVVLPASAPGILTGAILAMARAAGEVAPLMLVGCAKAVSALPLDGRWPFLHLDRKFMHLGFHIFDLGFQSPDVEAAKPMVYATAFLLILIVTLMNMVAIVLRSRLRKKYATSAV